MVDLWTPRSSGHAVFNMDLLIHALDQKHLSFASTVARASKCFSLWLTKSFSEFDGGLVLGMGRESNDDVNPDINSVAEIILDAPEAKPLLR